MAAKFSILVATLNSERTLERCLKSVRDQQYPQEAVEILVVDGGSSDQTLHIANKYGARVIPNPQVIPVAAKLLGLKNATGRYLVHLDSDEVFISRDALSKRLKAFTEQPEIFMVFASGYEDPPQSPFVNQYINEFGDPFSMYFYRLSKNHRFFIQEMRRRYPVKFESQDFLVIEIPPGRPQPILENAANGNAIDVDFFRNNFPDLCDNPFGPVHFFYHMQKFTRQFAITKNDAVIHYSADSWKGFLGKIKWRVKNNIFSLGDFGSAGFVGRVKFDTGLARWKPYFYLPYVALLLPVTLDALHLAVTRRNWRYLGHIPLSLVTLSYIMGYYLMKLAGLRPQLRSYGEQTTVSSKTSA